MQLKIEVERVEYLRVTLNGKDLGEFRKESEWEGFVKLRRGTSVIILSDDRSVMDRVFDNIMPSDRKPEFVVVKLSPSLMPCDAEESAQGEA